MVMYCHFNTRLILCCMHWVVMHTCQIFCQQFHYNPSTTLRCILFTESPISQDLYLKSLALGTCEVSRFDSNVNFLFAGLYLVLPSPPLILLFFPSIPSLSPLIQLGSLGEHCNSPSVGLGRAQLTNDLWRNFSLKWSIWQFPDVASKSPTLT